MSGSGLRVFVSVRSALLAAAVLLGVPALLWYQSSRGDKGTSPGFSRYNVDHLVNILEEKALDAKNPECDAALLICAETFARNGYRNASLMWLRVGAARGTSRKVAEALAQRESELAEAERRRGGSAGKGRSVR